MEGSIKTVSAPYIFFYISIDLFSFLCKISGVYSPLHQIETIIEMGCPVDGGEVVDSVAVARSDTLDEPLRFML